MTYSSLDEINPFERRVYQLMRDYCTNAEIAAECKASNSTITITVSRIYKRHNVSCRIEFLRLFREKIGCRYD